MLSTEDWAKSFGISVAANPPPVEASSKPCERSAREIAIRTLILQGVVAVASEVQPEAIVRWFMDQDIWGCTTPEEQALLQNPSLTEEQREKFAWHQEAEWALLWVLGKVEGLGLPTQTCDTRQLCDEIIPPLGSDITPFLASAALRPPGLLLAEDDRTYDLWCRALAARRKGEPLPDDLNWGVLYARRYASSGWTACRIGTR
jgi:hypothetical protein